MVLITCWMHWLGTGWRFINDFINTLWNMQQSNYEPKEVFLNLTNPLLWFILRSHPRRKCPNTSKECWELDAKITQTRKQALISVWKPNLWIFNILFISQLKLGFPNVILWQRIQEGRIAQKYESSTLRTRAHDFSSLRRPRAEPVILAELQIWKVRWDNMQGKYPEFLLKSSSSLLQRPGLICFFSRCETEQQLSFLVLACRGAINHLGLTSSAWSHSFLSTVGRMTGEKWVKHGYGTLYPPVGAQSPAYAAAAGVSQCHALFEGSTDLLHQDLWAEDEEQQSKMLHRQLFCYINIFLIMKTFTVKYKSYSMLVSPHRPFAFDSN